MKKIFLVIIITQIKLVFSMNAIPLNSINEVNEGTLLYKNEEKNQYEIIPNLNTNVKINIDGMVTHVTVDQMFTNKSSEPIEAIYVFPLPPNSAINDMMMIIDGRIIQGTIKEKEDAKKTYEKAKKEGKRTSLTVQQRPNIFTNKVANIMPEDTIIVRLQYVNELKYENGNFNLRFPMVVAPRYIAGSRVIGYSGTGWAYDTDIVPDASEITPHVTPYGMRSGNKISLQISLNPGLPIEEIQSSSHKIIKTKNKKNQFYIELDIDEFIPNKDFILSYKAKKGKKPKAALFVDQRGDDKYFMLMAVPPENNNKKININKEMIFVIDVSGSMRGTSIQQAKKSLLYSMETLNNGDSFNIIAYSDYYFSMHDKPLEVNENNIKDAKDFINSLHADGGTKALEPLKEAMLMDQDVNKVKMIVFITDGDLGYEKKVFDLVKNNLGTARLFSIGIGSAPNGHLLEKVSKSGRGTYTYINNINQVNEKMKSLLNKIDMPVLTDIKLNLKGQNELYPNPLPDLFINEPLVVFGKLNNKQATKLNATFSGNSSEGYFNLSIPINFSKGVGNNAISDIWARKKIDDLLDNWHLGDKNAKQNIVNLSIKHNLISKFTSFVAVEEKIVNPNGNNVVANIYTDLPYGWDYDAVFGNQKIKMAKNNAFKKTKNNYSNLDSKVHLYVQNLPKTSTNMPNYMVFGVFCFLISGLIFILANTRYEKSKF